MANLDFNKMVVAQVEVFTLHPYQIVVRELLILALKYDLFETASDEPETLLQKIIKFVQLLALDKGLPVLIGGHMSIGNRKLNEIVKKLCKDYQAEFLASVQPEMSEEGYLPSMTKASLKPHMRVLRCKTEGINGSVAQQRGGTSTDEEVSNCFIASKSLNLTEPSFLDMNEITGREIRMPSLQTFRPTQCSMEIPVRPPTHSGG